MRTQSQKNDRVRCACSRALPTEADSFGHSEAVIVEENVLVAFHVGLDRDTAHTKTTLRVFIIYLFAFSHTQRVGIC